MEPILIVAVVLAVLALVGGLWLFVGRRRGGQVPEEVSAHKPTRLDDLFPPEGEPAEGEPPTEEPAQAPAATLERPESIPGRMQRLRARLAGSGGFGKAILSVLSRGDLSETDWEEIEDTLLTSDLGIEVTTALMDELRTQAKVLDTSDPQAVREVLRAELLALVDPSLDRSLNLERPGAPAQEDAGAPEAGAVGSGADAQEAEGDQAPGEAGAAEGAAAAGPAPGGPAAAILMVGVNGTGKTTTCGKLARVLVAQDRTVVLGAADTFRAAAAEQLTTWGERVGVEVVRSEREGADPASVAFDAVRQAADQGADVVVVDTAGRLQNKAGLMDELGKIKRVMEKVAPVGEVLLVLDATTGQNGMRQAQVFSEAVGITGIVLTKLDGTAKGGIVVTVQKELGVPVKLVGLGEGADDLAPFDPEAFVDALLG
ncbi:signal recognition particle-docking protein FtsY [Actinomyces bowdenii]|uniref:signal recognition particle-docking protein FtsY n=1 Tax=Actinomyces bowdenii TaxID=131109 RepID=UPI001ABC382F|nr:signal recognition particle-docking protein FtsY [Actinomyces bowdenii]MBO3723845.1 signal recognition particle-docking protein FtsY [Actinomyces bowdenii]